jgi:hypothetical protein
MARNTAAAVLAGIPRVNLMPRVEIERRERADSLRKWGWGVVATLVALLLIIAGAFVLNWAAQQRLAAEQARTNELLTELAGLSDVSVALSAQDDLEAFRADAMASDLEWTRVYSTLVDGLPAGVTLTGFDLTVGPAPTPGDDVAAQVGLDGGLTFTSPRAVEIAQLIRTYRAIPGVIAAEGSDVSSAGDDAGYTYQLTITFDQSLYTGAFAQKAAE